MFALLYPHLARNLRLPRFHLCFPEIRKKIMPVLQAT